MNPSTEQAVRDRLRFDPPGAARITNETLQALGKARPWIIFLGWMMMLSAVLGGVMSIVLAFVDSGVSGPGAQIIGFLPIFYLVSAAIYFMGGSYLLQSASGLKKMGSGGAEAGLESFAKNQHSFWRLLGVTTLATIGVMGFVILTLGFVGMSSL